MKQRHSQQAVALVITLIMLSVITVIAVAFLAVSRRERASVSQSLHYLDAELALNAGFERVKAEIMANTIAQSNFVGPKILASRNVDGATNKYVPDDIALAFYDPRVPVYVRTNRDPTLPYDARFFYDLNRNGSFDESGLRPVLDDSGQQIPDGNGGFVSSYFTGDPQWIGIRGDYHTNAGPSFRNHYISRYAYAVLPIGTSLDLNWIHNEAKAKRGSRNPSDSYFYRNQGVGSWEINLAAFLVDLNTNMWGSVLDYDYQITPNGASRGKSFADATALLAYRHNGGLLLSARDLLALPLPPANLLLDDSIDMFADGPLPILVNGVPLSRFPSFDDDDPDLPWPGADSVNHFYHIDELWDQNRIPSYSTFVDNLQSAPTLTASTYNQTTAYRLISQLGVGSVPEDESALRPGVIPPKINLNYYNWTNAVDLTQPNAIVPKRESATNLFEWGRHELFTTLADRMLSEEPKVRVDEMVITTTNIPIFTNLSTYVTTNGVLLGPTGIPRFHEGVPVYNSRIQQCLQMAANILDARRGAKYPRQTVPKEKVDPYDPDPNSLPLPLGTAEIYPYYPTVYQPLFRQNGNDIYIRGFKEVDGPTFRRKLINGLIRTHRLEDPADRPTGGSSGGNMIYDDSVLFYGIPFIVGAKKGFPSFNEAALQTAVQVGRKLQFVKTDSTDRYPKVQGGTNQLMTMSISNVFAIEAWNPYSNAYPREVQMMTLLQTETVVTNDQNYTFTNMVVKNNYLSYPTNFFAANTWGPGEFRLTPLHHEIVIPESAYYTTPRPGFYALGATNKYEAAPSSFTDKWGMTVTNRLLFFMFDEEGEIFDAVSLAGLGTALNISDALASGEYADFWNQDVYGLVTEGVNNQMLVSRGEPGAPAADWNSYGGLDPTVGRDADYAKAFFRYFIGLTLTPPAKTNVPTPKYTAYNAPYVPTKKLYQTTSWEVNDPFVRFTADDLSDGVGLNSSLNIQPPTATIILTNNNSGLGVATLNKENKRYRPWVYDQYNQIANPHVNDSRIAAKDPNIRSPEDWEFPTNKFANIGWLGRVHRGTPWQTVYLKSDPISTDNWRSQVGASFFTKPGHMPTAPTNDWRLVDMITVAPHPNATKGALSVNQDGLASWSAVLSGIPVTALNTKGGAPFIEQVITKPAAFEPAVRQIVDGLNAQRGNQLHQRYQGVGQILGTPALTWDSPYLAGWKDLSPVDNPLRDEDYERIPQQILSLLKVGEARFVVYAFGQSLKPAPNSIIPSGPYFGMCTNYQVTAEAASRSVVRVDFELETDPASEDYGKPTPLKPHVVVESYNFFPVQ